MAATETEGKLQHSVDDCAEIAAGIRGIAEAAKRLVGGPLTMRALCVLIREALPRGSKTKVDVDDIAVVLQAAANLGAVHLKAVK